MEIDRRQILISLLETIEGISDKDYQKRIWIRGEGPEYDDFVETVCQFFDLGECVFNHVEDYNLTEQQYELLTKFRDEFDAFSEENDFPELFIDTPEWERIMDMAKEVLRAFDYQKPSS